MSKINCKDVKAHVQEGVKAAQEQAQSEAIGAVITLSNGINVKKTNDSFKYIKEAKQAHQFSSDQWYEEKLQKGKVISTVNWNEDFIDEDNGDVVSLPRHEILLVDGVPYKPKKRR